MLLAPTRTEETQDGASTTSVASYDPAGRTVTSKASTSGLTVADRAVSAVTTNYSPTTGLVTNITDGAKTQATTYDAWGRVGTVTDGTGSTATTVYDSAGRLKTSNDGKATYTYTYNGTDSRGKSERRGLVTSVEVGKPTEIGASTPSTFTGAYDDSGSLAEQVYPEDVKATWVRDINGVETGLSYKTSAGTPLLEYANTIDVDGRVITQTDATRTRWPTCPRQSKLRISHASDPRRRRYNRDSDLGSARKGPLVHTG